MRPVCQAAYEAPTMCYRPVQASGTAVLKTRVSHFGGAVLRAPRTSVCSCGRTEATRFCPPSRQMALPHTSLWSACHRPSCASRGDAASPRHSGCACSRPTTSPRSLRLRLQGTPRCWRQPNGSVQSAVAPPSGCAQVCGAGRGGRASDLPLRSLSAAAFSVTSLITWPLSAFSSATLPGHSRGLAEAAGGAVRTMSRGHARSLRSGWCCVRGMGGGRRGPCTDWPSGDPVPRQEAQSRRRGQFRKEGAHVPSGG